MLKNKNKNEWMLFFLVLKNQWVKNPEKRWFRWTTVSRLLTADTTATILINYDKIIRIPHDNIKINDYYRSDQKKQPLNFF